MMIKYLRQCKIVVFFSMMLTSCFSFQRYRDISDTPQAIHLIGKRLVLQQDVFLFQYSDTKNYSLELPGIGSDLPTSIAEYERDPWNWKNTDSNAQKGRGIANGYMKNDVIAVIPSGSTLWVEKAVEKRISSMPMPFVKVISHLDDPRFSSLSVDIYFLLEKDYSTFTFYPKPGVIEYCD